MKYDPAKATTVGRLDPGGYRRAGVACETIYFFNGQTNTLGGFWTGSPTFRTPNGTTVGMTQAEANRRERRQGSAGCESGIGKTAGRNYMLLANIGGHIKPGSSLLEGGNVYSLAVED